MGKYAARHRWQNNGPDRETCSSPALDYRTDRTSEAPRLESILVGSSPAATSNLLFVPRPVLKRKLVPRLVSAFEIFVQIVSQDFGRAYRVILVLLV